MIIFLIVFVYVSPLIAPAITFYFRWKSWVYLRRHPSSLSRSCVRSLADEAKPKQRKRGNRNWRIIKGEIDKW